MQFLIHFSFKDYLLSIFVIFLTLAAFFSRKIILKIKHFILRINGDTTQVNKHSFIHIFFKLLEGSKAWQYVYLIGHAIIKLALELSTPNETTRFADFLERLVDTFTSQSRILATHPNSLIYASLARLVPNFEGLYLKPSPCFICNSI